LDSIYTELRWLPRPPETFAEQLKQLAPGPHLGDELRRLATSALDLNQLTRLARSIARLKKGGATLQPLLPIRLALLSNATIQMLAPALVASAARHGFDLELLHPPYGQVAQEALDTGSSINRARPDAVLFALDHRALALDPCPGDRDAAEATVQRALDYYRQLSDGIKQGCDALCIFETLAAPPEALFGSLDRALPGTLRNLIDRINAELATFASSTGNVLLDTAAIAETVGLAAWHSPTLWNLAKLPFADEFIPLYAEHVARTLAAIRGKSRKVLVLDLDNTLWGGIIGDDGIANIRIAQGDPVGEAHLALQRMALELRRRGVVLAVCSKNTDEVARRPFLQHPEVLLKLEHIAVFQANWNDKATNLRAIAEELSLGLESLVFLDDNPMERGLVRSLLPQVAVPELPDDPAGYARTLAAAGYFEAIAFAEEDRRRADYYQENARRASLMSQVGGVEAYLASLGMTITFHPFDAAGRARIVQLINKSNQYNLTTRRYTEHEVFAAEADPSVFTMQVRLEDIFGDNGMISVVICRPAVELAAWEIDTWLMSCRVLGREVEHVVLRQLIEHARHDGVRKLIGRYLPSERNAIASGHYAKLGFVKVQQEPCGASLWERSVEAEPPQCPPMKVISEGFLPRSKQATEEGVVA